MTARALMILFILVVVSVEVFAIVHVVRSPLRKKWAWILLALVGVTDLQLLWATGAAGFQVLSVSLLGFGVVQSGGGPWIVSVSFPIGAIMALRKARSAEIDPGEAPVSIALDG